MALGQLHNSYCRNPEVLEPLKVVVLSRSALMNRLAELTMAESGIIQQAVLDAAMIRSDVHIYRSPITPVIGISIEPGTGPNVKVWEH